MECPKRRSSYILFGNHIRQTQKEDLKDLSSKEIINKIAEMWRETPDEKKSVFEQKAKEEKQAYDAYVKKYGKPERKKKNGKKSKINQSDSSPEKKNGDEKGKLTFEDLDKDLQKTIKFMQKTWGMNVFYA